MKKKIENDIIKLYRLAVVVRIGKKEKKKKYDSGMWPATKVQRMRYVSYLTSVVRVWGDNREVWIYR